MSIFTRKWKRYIQMAHWPRHRMMCLARKDFRILLDAPDRESQMLCAEIANIQPDWWCRYKMAPR